MPRKFAPPKIQTSLVLLNLVTHLQSWVWWRGVVHDSKKWHPRIHSSISQSARIPRELLQERGSDEPRNDTALKLVCQIFVRELFFFFFFLFYSPLNDNIKHKGFCLSVLTLLLNEIGLGSLIPLTSDGSLME